MEDLGSAASFPARVLVLEVYDDDPALFLRTAPWLKASNRLLLLE